MTIKTQHQTWRALRTKSTGTEPFSYIMIDNSRIVDSKSDEKDFNNFSDKGVVVK